MLRRTLASLQRGATAHPGQQSVLVQKNVYPEITGVTFRFKKEESTTERGAEREAKEGFLRLLANLILIPTGQIEVLKIRELAQQLRDLLHARHARAVPEVLVA